MNTNETTTGLYIHIPFCAAKCRYCDFLSFAGQGEEIRERYVQALKKELRLDAAAVGSAITAVDSVFIGGGTPSLLTPAQLASLLEEIAGVFPLTRDPEITMEANPGTLTEEKLRACRTAGIKRLSLGVQSLDAGLLRFMGRIHSPEEFLENYALARRCGFENINLDLIFGIPGQSLSQWQSTLEQALSLEPEHLSFYSLQIEEGTAFYEMEQKGELKLPDQEADRQMYHWALERLDRAAYLHYEISNAAKNGFLCRHNLKYWSMEDYLGAGLGAHSFIGGLRFSNETALGRYLECLEAAPPREDPPCGPAVVWRHRNTEQDQLSDFLFTGLRKTHGVSLSEFSRRFGAAPEVLFPQAVPKHLAAGLLEKDEAADRLRLTSRGLDLFNLVLRDLV
ncbi:MAG: radical SAM family heme chaperone HemW [Bacillota bacterium]|nr:radical SAM family heme chaperone HemW [Bacillota bacterium]